MSHAQHSHALNEIKVELQISDAVNRVPNDDVDPMSEQQGRRGSPPRGNGRRGNLRSLDRLGLSDFDEDEHNRPPETPPYSRRNMSQLTLPPEYLSDGGPHDADDDDENIPPVPSRSRADEKRPAEGDNDDIGVDNQRERGAHAPTPPALTLQTSDGIVPIRQRTGSTPLSAPVSASRSQPPSSARSEKDPAAFSTADQSGLYDGETLVHGRKDTGKHHINQSVHYPDEHGGLMHDSQNASRDFRVPGTRRSSIDSSRAPSVADTDGEEEPDEFYDWSDEDDLVDQEAHFETKLNQRSRKKKTWGIRRCVVNFCAVFVLSSSLLPSLLARRDVN